MMPVNTIQRPLLVLILPPDSNVESSNMASLEIGCWLPLIRHRENFKCSPASKRDHKCALSLYQNKASHEKPAAKPVQLRREFPYNLARFAAGKTVTLPLFARHSCQATSMGAAMAMEE